MVVVVVVVMQTFSGWLRLQVTISITHDWQQSLTHLG